MEGEINPYDFTWSEIKISEGSKASFMSYEKTSHTPPELPFDSYRFCEWDRIISTWKNEKSLSRKTLVNEFRILFGNLFLIDTILYDLSKFYVFKIKAKASKIGKLEKNKYVKFDLEIVEENASVNNQIQCLGLLNYSDRFFQIRRNSYVYFYITEIYS